MKPDSLVSLGPFSIKSPLADIGLLLVLPLLLTVLPQIMAGKHELQAVVKGNSLFTQQLYNRLASEAQPQDNIFFSPISAHAALSMTYQGAKGATYTAFTKVLGVKDHNTAAAGYHDVMLTLNNVSNVTLHLANKIYVKTGYKLKDAFLTTTNNNFHSEVIAMAFTPADTAAATINQWVEDKTHNKIKDLIKPDDLTEDTRLILINAIYFKGDWKYKFNKNHTKTEKFYLNDHDTIDVHMMKQKRRFNYKEDADLDAKVLEMPYANENLSLVIVLPNERNGIAKLEQKLATYDLTKITDGMLEPEVEVQLPKFKIETKMDLGDILTKMGLEVAFSDNADFSDMLEGEPVKISKVIQKAFIEINEEGSEAAAATGIGMVLLSLPLPVPPADFIADHPFIILLNSRGFMVDKERQAREYFSNVVLFKGKIANPVA